MGYDERGHGLDQPELPMRAVNPTLYEVCKNVQLYDGSRVIEGESGGTQATRYERTAN